MPIEISLDELSDENYHKKAVIKQFKKFGFIINKTSFSYGW